MTALPKREKITRDVGRMMFRTLLLVPHSTKPKPVEFLAIGVDIIVHVSGKSWGADDFAGAYRYSIAEFKSIPTDHAGDGNSKVSPKTGKVL
jgi:hypothetical protein